MYLEKLCKMIGKVIIGKTCPQVLYSLLRFVPGFACLEIGNFLQELKARVDSKGMILILTARSSAAAAQHYWSPYILYSRGSQTYSARGVGTCRHNILCQPAPLLVDLISIAVKLVIPSEYLVSWTFHQIKTSRFSSSIFA